MRATSPSWLALYALLLLPDARAYGLPPVPDPTSKAALSPEERKIAVQLRPDAGLARGAVPGRRAPSNVGPGAPWRATPRFRVYVGLDSTEPAALEVLRAAGLEVLAVSAEFRRAVGTVDA